MSSPRVHELLSYRCKELLTGATKAGEGYLAHGSRGRPIMVQSMGRELADHVVVTVGSQRGIGGNAQPTVSSSPSPY